MQNFKYMIIAMNLVLAWLLFSCDGKPPSDSIEFSKNDNQSSSTEMNEIINSHPSDISVDSTTKLIDLIENISDEVSIVVSNIINKVSDSLVLKNSFDFDKKMPASDVDVTYNYKVFYDSLGNVLFVRKLSKLDSEYSCDFFFSKIPQKEAFEVIYIKEHNGQDKNLLHSVILCDNNNREKLFVAWSHSKTNSIKLLSIVMLLDAKTLSEISMLNLVTGRREFLSFFKKSETASVEQLIYRPSSQIPTYSISLFDLYKELRTTPSNEKFYAKKNINIPSATYPIWGNDCYYLIK